MIVEALVHSVQFSRSVMSESLRPHGLQLARPPCPSTIRGACSDACPWAGDAIWSSHTVVHFSPHLQSFPASGSFQMSQFFTSGGQSIGVSASVLPMNIQDWFPLGWTGLISLHSKGLSKVFSNTTVRKHQFLSYLDNKHTLWTIIFQKMHLEMSWWKLSAHVNIKKNSVDSIFKLTI